MTGPEAPDTVHFETGEALDAWLEANGSDADELWIEIFKKHTGVKSLSWPEIVDAALCFGWIDSQSRRIDEDRYRQRLTPRRARNKWSKVKRADTRARAIEKLCGMIERGEKIHPWTTRSRP